MTIRDAALQDFEKNTAVNTSVQSSLIFHAYPYVKLAATTEQVGQHALSASGSFINEKRMILTCRREDGSTEITIHPRIVAESKLLQDMITSIGNVESIEPFVSDSLFTMVQNLNASIGADGFLISDDNHKKLSAASKFFMIDDLTDACDVYYGEHTLQQKIANLESVENLLHLWKEHEETPILRKICEKQISVVFEMVILKHGLDHSPIEDSDSYTLESLLTALDRYAVRLHQLELISVQDLQDADLNIIIQHQPGLRFLTLMDCQHLTDAIGELFELLPHLQQLNLSGCSKITDRMTDFFKDLPRLEYLNLTFCTQLTDDMGRNFAFLPRLRHLTLSKCQNLTDAIGDSFRYLPLLENLNLSFCGLLTDRIGQALSYLPHLSCLILVGTSLTDEIGGYFCHIPFLKALNLSGSGKLTERIGKYVEDLALLEYLMLSECPKMSIKVLDNCKKLTHLQHLDISGYSVSTDEATYIDSILAHLAHLRIIGLKKQVPKPVASPPASNANSLLSYFWKKLRF